MRASVDARSTFATEPSFRAFRGKPGDISGSVINSVAGDGHMVAWTLVAHIFGLVLWVGGLLMTALLLSQHGQVSSPEAGQAIGRLERAVLRGMADPGAFLTLVAGIVLILTNRYYYLHAGWLHIKLVFVFILLLLHGFLAMRSKAFAKRNVAVPPGQARFLFIAIALVFLSILIATLPGKFFLT